MTRNTVVLTLRSFDPALALPDSAEDRLWPLGMQSRTQGECRGLLTYSMKMLTEGLSVRRRISRGERECFGRGRGWAFGVSRFD